MQDVAERSAAPIGFTTLAPCTARIDGERRHKFCIPGITLILFLGGLVPERHDRGALNSVHGKFMWLSPFADDSLFQGFANGSARRARQRRSFNRSPGRTGGRLRSAPNKRSNRRKFGLRSGVGLALLHRRAKVRLGDDVVSVEH